MHDLKIENLDFGVTIHGHFTLIREIYGAVAWAWARMYVTHDKRKYIESFGITPLRDGSYKIPSKQWFRLRHILLASSVPDVS
jgi:hypothetical protein